MSKLTLRYQYDSSVFDPDQQTDDFGWLEVKVETDRFSGDGGCWVQWQVSTGTEDSAKVGI